MSLLSKFKLAKLTISAYSDSDRKKPVGSDFEVLFNPESFTLRYESVFQRSTGLGPNAKRAGWVRGKPSTLALQLVFDGTRVSYMPVNWRKLQSVAKQISEFLASCYQPNSDSHEPLYLTLKWGDGPFKDGFKCRLKSVDVNYTSFNRDGSPQRATLSANFVEDFPTGKARFSSPDLTHRRIVKAGDTLPLLCIEIYGAAKHYLRVAQANELDDFRELVPGTELVFPPFERAGS